MTVSRNPLLFGVALALALAGGCQDGGRNVRPAVFERPGDVAFVCFDRTTRLPAPMSECTTQGTDGPTTEGVHALVTQTVRGEVASVDLRTDDDGRVVDLDRRIPGFTFLPVGAQPTSIAVLPTAPYTTYVASLGSREIVAIETSRFRRDAQDGAPGEDRPPRVVDRLDLPAGPTDMVLVERGGVRALLVTLPVTGEVRRVDLEADGTFGATGPLEGLASVAGPPVTAAPGDLVDHCRVCPLPDPTSAEPCDGLDPVPTVPAREPVTVGDGPRPVALALDEDGTVYVADGNLPLVHVLTPPSFEDMPIPVAVPTSDVAVTPLVPARVGDVAATERYLYAVDATDGSVLVVDLDLGAVLPISNEPSTAPDRIPLLAAATTLEVLTPDYDPANVALCDLAEARADDRVVHPRRARGVFLAVGLTTGVVRFIDVVDLDATCRGGDAACTMPLDEDDLFVAIRRHLPRSGEWWDDPVTVPDPPTLSEERRTTRIDENGRPRSGDTLWFEPLPDCASDGPSVYRQVYPPPPEPGEQPSDPLLCARDDPFVLGAEQWQLSWEGAVPGTVGGRGRFADDGGDVVSFDAPLPDGAAEVRFCDRGVIGPVAPLPDAVLGGYGGDVLEVLGPLPAASLDVPGCEETFLDEDEALLRIDFPILQSFADRLDVARTSRPLGGNGPEVDLDEVRRCFPGAVRFQVRVGEAFRVLGSRTLFKHPIFAGADGRCRVDETRPLDVGRARWGVPFDDGQIVFTLAPPAEAGGEGPRRIGPAERVLVDFLVADYTPKLRVELGARGLPTAIRWLAPAQRLYVVDQGGAGLLEYAFEEQSTSFRSGELRPEPGRVFN